MMTLSRPDRILSDMKLENFFDETEFSTDLTEGVIFNPARTRLCLLSTDLLRGIYLALFDEAGQAWSVIFKNCGQIWGDRVANRLDDECRLRHVPGPGQLPVPAYLQFMSGYFLAHGWGELQFDLSVARERGLVAAELKHTVFTDIVTDADQMVDAMPSGLLAGLLGHVSARKLDCVQTTCPSRGAPTSRFILGSPERLKDSEAMIRTGSQHDDLLAKL